VDVGDRPEISDLVVTYDPDSFARLPVRRADVLAELDHHGMRRALRIVAGWPSVDGVLDRPGTKLLDWSWPAEGGQSWYLQCVRRYLRCVRWYVGTWATGA
jgi:hypothetical protein